MSVVDFSKALIPTEEIQLTVTDQAGRESRRPVWFVQEGNSLYLLPVKGSDTDWYKNILKTPTMSINAGGKDWSGEVKPVTDKARVRDIVEKFRKKYGADQVKKYYSKFDVAVNVRSGGTQRRSA